MFTLIADNIRSQFCEYFHGRGRGVKIHNNQKQKGKSMFVLYEHKRSCNNDCGTLKKSFMLVEKRGQ